MTTIPPKNNKPKNNDAEIFRDFIESKNGNRGIGDVLLKHGISRSNLYDVVSRVRNGNPRKIKRDVEKARLTALWEHKYRARFLSLPKNREASTVVTLRALIHDMDKDGFPQLVIAGRLCKDRSTIIHHLEN